MNKAELKKYIEVATLELLKESTIYEGPPDPIDADSGVASDQLDELEAYVDRCISTINAGRPEDDDNYHSFYGLNSVSDHITLVLNDPRNKQNVDQLTKLYKPIIDKIYTFMYDKEHSKNEIVNGKDLKEFIKENIVKILSEDDSGVDYNQPESEIGNGTVAIILIPVDRLKQIEQSERLKHVRRIVVDINGSKQVAMEYVPSLQKLVSAGHLQDNVFEYDYSGIVGDISEVKPLDPASPPQLEDFATSIANEDSLR